MYKLSGHRNAPSKSNFITVVEVAANCKRLRDAKENVETGSTNNFTGRVAEKARSKYRSRESSLLRWEKLQHVYMMLKDPIEKELMMQERRNN